ncbi:MAG: carbohydrate ABC transporter permease [Bacteroidota bacterium]
MAYIFLLSMQKYNPVQGGIFVGFQNYLNLLRDTNFWWTLLNSIVYIAVTPVLIILSLCVAMIIREKIKGRKIFRTIYFLPVVTPIVITGIAWRWLFNEDVGLLNFLLVKSGISTHNIHWLTQYPVNLISVMGVTIWRGIGYYMVIFLAGLMGIPKELEEASIIDGASWFQRTLHITVPLLKPSITLVFIISSISAIKVFTEIYIILPGAPIQNKTLVAYMYQTAFEHFDLGYASALGVVLFLFTLIFSYMNMKLLERGSAP